MRHCWTPVIAAAGLLLLASCGKDRNAADGTDKGLTCHKLQDRNRQCSQQIATVITEKQTGMLPAKTRKKLSDRLAKSIISRRGATAQTVEHILSL